MVNGQRRTTYHRRWQSQTHQNFNNTRFSQSTKWYKYICFMCALVDFLENWKCDNITTFRCENLFMHIYDRERERERRLMLVEKAGSPRHNSEMAWRKLNVVSDNCHIHIYRHHMLLFGEYWLQLQLLLVADVSFFSSSMLWFMFVRYI